MKTQSLQLNLLGSVIGMKGDSDIISRLFDLGIYKGVSIEVLGKAPFGGPYLVKAGMTLLALRESEAQCLIIQKIS